MTTVVAGAVGKAAVSGAKHKAEQKFESRKARISAEKAVSAKRTERVKSAGTGVKKTAVKGYRTHRTFANKSAVTSHYRILLIAMFFVGTAILLTAFFQNDNLVPAQKIKKLAAFWFAMFVLSLVVLIKPLARIAGYLSVVIVIALGLTNRQDITSTFNSFSNGLTAPPIGTGVAKGVQKQVPIGNISPVIPRSTDNSSNNTIYT